jgi:hypothetical protein
MDKEVFLRSQPYLRPLCGPSAVEDLKRSLSFDRILCDAFCSFLVDGRPIFFNTHTEAQAQPQGEGDRNHTPSLQEAHAHALGDRTHTHSIQENRERIQSHAAAPQQQQQQQQLMSTSSQMSLQVFLTRASEDSRVPPGLFLMLDENVYFADHTAINQIQYPKKAAATTAAKSSRTSAEDGHSVYISWPGVQTRWGMVTTAAKSSQQVNESLKSVVRIMNSSLKVNSDHYIYFLTIPHSITPLKPTLAHIFI